MGGRNLAYPIEMASHPNVADTAAFYSVQIETCNRRKNVQKKGYQTWKCLVHVSCTCLERVRGAIHITWYIENVSKQSVVKVARTGPHKNRHLHSWALNLPSACWNFCLWLQELCSKVLNPETLSAANLS